MESKQVDQVVGSVSFIWGLHASRPRQGADPSGPAYDRDGYQSDHDDGGCYGRYKFHDRCQRRGMEVLIAINRMESGRGLSAGLSIVIIAILLDRLTQSVIRKEESQ